MKMSQVDTSHSNEIPAKAAPSFWKAIVLVIIFTFVAVALFGLLVALFISGAEDLGLPTAGHIVILIIISGVFAWLVKRLSDTVSGMSHLWFPEEDS